MNNKLDTFVLKKFMDNFDAVVLFTKNPISYEEYDPGCLDEENVLLDYINSIDISITEEIIKSYLRKFINKTYNLDTVEPFTFKFTVPLGDFTSGFDEDLFIDSVLENNRVPLKEVLHAIIHMKLK